MDRIYKEPTRNTARVGRRRRDLARTPRARLSAASLPTTTKSSAPTRTCSSRRSPRTTRPRRRTAAAASATESTYAVTTAESAHAAAAPASSSPTTSAHCIGARPRRGVARQHLLRLDLRDLRDFSRAARLPRRRARASSSRPARPSPETSSPVQGSVRQGWRVPGDRRCLRRRPSSSDAGRRSGAWRAHRWSRQRWRALRPVARGGLRPPTLARAAPSSGQGEATFGGPAGAGGRRLARRSRRRRPRRRGPAPRPSSRTAALPRPSCPRDRGGDGGRDVRRPPPPSRRPGRSCDGSEEEGLDSRGLVMKHPLSLAGARGASSVRECFARKNKKRIARDDRDLRDDRARVCRRLASDRGRSTASPAGPTPRHPRARPASPPRHRRRRRRSARASPPRVPSARRPARAAARAFEAKAEPVVRRGDSSVRRLAPATHHLVLDAPSTATRPAVVPDAPPARALLARLTQAARPRHAPRFRRAPARIRAWIPPRRLTRARRRAPPAHARAFSASVATSSRARRRCARRSASTLRARQRSSASGACASRTRPVAEDTRERRRTALPVVGDQRVASRRGPRARARRRRPRRRRRRRARALSSRPPRAADAIGARARASLGVSPCGAFFTLGRRVGELVSPLERDDDAVAALLRRRARRGRRCREGPAGDDEAPTTIANPIGDHARRDARRETMYAPHQTHVPAPLQPGARSGAASGPLRTAARRATARRAIRRSCT